MTSAQGRAIFFEPLQRAFELAKSGEQEVFLVARIRDGFANSVVVSTKLRPQEQSDVAMDAALQVLQAEMKEITGWKRESPKDFFKRIFRRSR